MTVKLAHLKSGENIISDIQEMVVGEGDNSRVVGYLFNKPQVVLLKDFEIVPSPKSQRNEFPLETEFLKITESGKQITLSAEPIIGA